MVPYDATVKVKDGSVRVHRVVLITRSRFFRKRFQIQGPEIGLPGRVEVAREIVRFLYTARLPQAERMAVEMPLLGALYGDEVPIFLFAQFWPFAISVENVVDVFLRAVKSRCADLVKFCRPFIVANRSSLKPAALKKLKRNRQAVMLLW